MIPVSKPEKTVHALDHVATVTGPYVLRESIIRENIKFVITPIFQAHKTESGIQVAPHLFYVSLHTSLWLGPVSSKTELKYLKLKHALKDDPIFQTLCSFIFQSFSWVDCWSISN
jgi:hypothetical protein